MNPSQKTGLKSEKTLPGPAAESFPKGESMESQAVRPDHQFSEAERAAVYRTIFSRRDVRGQFLPDAIPDEVLSRVLMAAHHAPSVGFMQPWNFLVVRSQDVKQRVHDLFKKANAEAAQMFDGEKREVYSRLKLEGILESPVNLCITCDRKRTGPVVVGRTHIRTMDLYSSVCAVQNLWLAARAEGLGVGWVSIFNQRDVQDALQIPRNIVPVAYLCLGYVSHFYDKPELESAGWLPRLPIDQLVYIDQWEQQAKADDPLIDCLRQQQATIQENGLNGTLNSTSSRAR
ncbi:5,6-dimethylbenzimidazole synthase [Paraburkholderia sp.]|uniref:5,6-dimethylbenzimidazole synthase n=1 Tax=Paraburkholderia sp. TaxID=1926495 RepID=UPI0025EA760E|nr:5,6-dimethylbenzimidazole synthase [Paraburkholderia sp.]